MSVDQPLFLRQEMTRYPPHFRRFSQLSKFVNIIVTNFREEFLHSVSSLYCQYTFVLDFHRYVLVLSLEKQLDLVKLFLTPQLSRFFPLHQLFLKIIRTGIYTRFNLFNRARPCADAVFQSLRTGLILHPRPTLFGSVLEPTHFITLRSINCFLINRDQWLSTPTFVCFKVLYGKFSFAGTCT